MTVSNAPADHRNLLLAVDASDNARRAVDYVARMLGGCPGFRITLLHVIPEPEEDFFPTEEERREWLDGYRENTAALLETLRQRLLSAGIAPDAVATRSPLRDCPSLARCILKERDALACGTVVVGRKGMSRSEEFLFGSVSSAVVRHAENGAVWVVE